MVEKTGREILIDYIKEDAQDSEKSMQNLIFKDDFSKEDEEKISQKAAELLAFLSDKDSAQIREILESVTIEDAQSLEGSSSLLMGKFAKLDDIKDEQTQNLSRSIITLNEELEQINPHKFDFDKKGVLAFIPFVAKPINRYLKKFQSAKEVIKDTLSHIEDGEKILREDNALLQEEKQYYKQKAVSLQRKAVVFEKIAKEGRKFGLFMILSSQRPSELSKTVLSQCNNFILHRIRNNIDLEQMRKSIPYILDAQLLRLSYLKTGHALVVGEGFNIQLELKIHNDIEDKSSETFKPSEVWKK